MSTTIVQFVCQDKVVSSSKWCQLQLCNLKQRLRQRILHQIIKLSSDFMHTSSGLQIHGASKMFYGFIYQDILDIFKMAATRT